MKRRFFLLPLPLACLLACTPPPAQPSWPSQPLPAGAGPRNSEPASAQISKSEGGPSQESGHDVRYIGWISIGIGASALAIALGTSYLMLHDKSVRDSNCNSAKACTDDGLNANADISRLSGVNAASWAVGVAGLGVGTLVLLTSSADGERKTTLGVAPNGSGGGIMLRSVF